MNLVKVPSTPTANIALHLQGTCNVNVSSKGFCEPTPRPYLQWYTHRIHGTFPVSFVVSRITGLSISHCIILFDAYTQIFVYFGTNTCSMLTLISVHLCVIHVANAAAVARDVVNMQVPR